MGKRRFDAGDLIELSSFRSQSECWNNGILEQWVLGNWGSDLLAKSYGSENLIDKEVKERETSL